MAVPYEFHILESFFNEHEHEYNFISKEDCGRFTENFLIYLRNVTGNLQFKHLRKYGTATQYNKHAIDVLAYDNRGEGDGTPIMEIDILGGAESPNAKPTWQVRNTSYQAKDLMEPEEIEQDEPSDMVPWVPYDEPSFNNRLQQQLAYDYGRRPQDADFQVSVWSARVFHSAYMGPEGKPLGFNGAFKKHRPEWCAELGVPVDDTWF